MPLCKDNKKFFTQAGFIFASLFVLCYRDKTIEYCRKLRVQVRCKSGAVPPAVIPVFRESQNAEYTNSSAGKEVGYNIRLKSPSIIN